MANDPRAGTPAQPGDLVDIDALLAAYHGAPSRSGGDRAQRVAFGTSGHRGSSFATTFNDDHIAATSQAIVEYRAGQGTDGPAVHRPRHPRAVGARVAHRAGGVRRQRRHGARRLGRRLHPHPRGVARDPAVQPPAGATAWPTAWSSRRRTTRRPTAASSTTRTNGGPADTDATSWIATAPTSCWRRSSTGVRRRSADPSEFGRYDFLGDLRRRPAQRRRHRRDPRRRGAHRRRPARRRQRGLLGGDRRAPRPRPHRGQPGRRPAVRVHDAGLGRQDPHGLLVAVRDGLAGGRARPVPDLHRQRRRRRPARHRHRRRRPDEPQPLPRRRHRLPVRQPARLAGRRGHRQDRRQLVDDRPGGRRPGPHAGGDARRVQVVRARPARRVAGLRRRGERGRVVPAHATAACGPPTRTASSSALLASEILAVTGKTPVAALRRAHRAVRRARLRPHRRRHHPGGQGEAGQAVGVRRHGRPSWPASRSPRGSPRPPATARRSAG